MPKLENKCLTPNCQDRPAWKGLCPKHYKVAKKTVEAGHTTWQALERLGLADLGSKDGADFLDAMNQRIKEEDDLEEKQLKERKHAKG